MRICGYIYCIHTDKYMHIIQYQFTGAIGVSGQLVMNNVDQRQGSADGCVWTVRWMTVKVGSMQRSTPERVTSHPVLQVSDWYSSCQKRADTTDHIRTDNYDADNGNKMATSDEAKHAKIRIMAKPFWTFIFWDWY